MQWMVHNVLAIIPILSKGSIILFIFDFKIYAKIVFFIKNATSCIYFLVLPIMNSKTHNYLDLGDILSEKGISRTNFRTKLVNYFFSSNKSLSVDDILKYFNNSINKATVYRSLVSFENNGLIHKVPDANNLMRYSLCRKEECSTISHNHNHGHFICYSCNQTFCLEGVKYPEIISTKGFYVREIKLTVEGYCNECYKN